MDDVPHPLASLRLFRRVDVDAIAGLLAQCSERVLRQGELLLDPERANHVLYIVLKGELQVLRRPDSRIPLAWVGAGECVGEMSFIEATLPSAYVNAGVDSRLLAVPHELLESLISAQPQFAVNLMQVLSERIRSNNLALANSLEAQQRYRSAAERDALTGLHNRRWMQEIFPAQLEVCGRIGQPAALLLIDIDYFKRVNDGYGHAVGDQALVHLARMFTERLRPTDLCARFGGEEFIVLMPATALSEGWVVAERLRVRVARTPLAVSSDENLHLTFSGGIASWEPGLSLEQLTIAADRALYLAKREGRNCIRSSFDELSVDDAEAEPLPF